MSWQRRDDSGEEVRRQRNPAAAATLFDCSADTPALPRFVEVSPLQPSLLDLAYAHPGRVEDEHGQRVPARNQRHDGFDVFGGRRGRRAAFLAR